MHFNGAGGNVAAGKYNDGQPHRRQELADRVAAAMAEAWADAKANRQPAVAADVGWFIEPVSLPLSPRLEGEEVEGQQLAIIADESADEWERLRTARDVVYARRVRAGRSIDLTCLRIGPARLISMPGELFVEYQLEAQRLAAENGAVSMMAACKSKLSLGAFVISAGRLSAILAHRRRLRPGVHRHRGFVRLR